MSVDLRFGQWQSVLADVECDALIVENRQFRRELKKLSQFNAQGVPIDLAVRESAGQVLGCRFAVPFSDPDLHKPFPPNLGWMQIDR
jgi:hypothetical protein